MITTRIESFAEYISAIEHLDHDINATHSLTTLTMYRGQTDENWKLLPSFFRELPIESENLLFTELKHNYPEAITDDRFNSLVKLQHFGLPTRLMDMTINPLVALYFACKESGTAYDKNGAVFAFQNQEVLWPSNPKISLIMDYIFDWHPLAFDLEGFLNYFRQRHSGEFYSELPLNGEEVKDILTKPVYGVMPDYTNERVAAQEGAFLLFGMKGLGENNIDPLGIKKEFLPINDLLEEIPTENIVKLIIPGKMKRSLLETLDLLGISERTLFPDLEHQIRYTVEYVKTHSAQ